MRILVAEDERVTRTSLVRQLQAWGHEVTAAEDGERAWELFLAGGPPTGTASEGGPADGFDIILTDWEMPRLSGLELIRRIRSQGSTRFVYIIMLTGRSEKADVVSGIEAGADDFVHKPFDREELRVRLLAGERTVRLERTLSRRNEELRIAGERMRYDLEAASRVQRAMLPRANIDTPSARTGWKYVPTDALAGDAIGLHLVGAGDRYLIAYVADVSGHGVPAALLSVTAMHALAPVPVESSLLRDMSAAGSLGTVRAPARVAAEMNRRFRSGDSDGRYLTLVLCVLDTHTGSLHYARAGHAPPTIVRRGRPLSLPDTGGLPIAIVDDSDYEDATLQLEPGDRVWLFSDGMFEQSGPGGCQFGLERLTDLCGGLHAQPPQDAVEAAVARVAEWAGGTSFADDVSLAAIDWLGHRPA